MHPQNPWNFGEVYLLKHAESYHTNNLPSPGECVVTGRVRSVNDPPAGRLGVSISISCKSRAKLLPDQVSSMHRSGKGEKMLRKDVLHGPINSDGVRDGNDVNHKDHDIKHDIHNTSHWSLSEK